ncbi:MAG: CRISPR-associated endonuclease Cas2 [Candidatus Competibacteraceae bacterium]|nr:CRISPR-associated endonuclease Cas2 [Candidatus Competibacteraceae bacterium]
MARQRRLYLICYDIAEDPKRLSWVARYLEKVAFRVQYSVFVGSLFRAFIGGRDARFGADYRPAQGRCALLPFAGASGNRIVGAATVSR